MTRPEPLVITDIDGDQLNVRLRDTNAGETLWAIAGCPTEGVAVAVEVTRHDARRLVRWLAAWLGEPAVAEHLGYVRCARCNVLLDPVTGHHCAATDDEQVRAWVEREQPFPPAVSKTALTGEAVVTHVEGQAQ